MTADPAPQWHQTFGDLWFGVRPSDPAPPTGTVVAWCPHCRCKTWHFEGRCEWWDLHKPAPSEPDGGRK